MNYGPEVLTLFRDAEHAGTIPGGASGRARGRTGRVEVVFSATTANGRITGMRYGALGCPWVIAACERVCRGAEGEPVEALAGIDAPGLASALGAPVEKTGSLLVIEDAIAALRRAIGDRQAENRRPTDDG